MSATQYFDVVVLGRSLGALGAGALLAKRGFRVLVVGHGEPAARYSFEGHALARRTFIFSTAESPAFLQIQRELAIAQLVRRTRVAESTIFHWYRARDVFAAEAERTALVAAVARGFAVAAAPVEEFYAQLSANARTTDFNFQTLLELPVQGFFARRRARNLLKSCPHFGARLDESHDRVLGQYAQVVRRTAEQLSNAYPNRSALAVLRLHGFWMRGCQTLEQGEDGLAQILCDRIVAQGGDVRLHERATHLFSDGRKLRALSFGDARIQIGFDALISSQSLLGLRDCLDQNAGLSLARETAAAPTAERFVLSVVVQEEFVPTHLPHSAFLETDDPELGTLFLQRESGALAGTVLLLLEAHLVRGVLPLLRERLLEALERVVPYLTDGLVVVDSAHDGRPLFDYRSGARQPVARVTFRATGAELQAESMVPLHYPMAETATRGFVQQPTATALENVWVCNEQVMPALGQEGVWLAAAECAALVRLRDPSKERLRRMLWGKVEVR